MRFKQIINLIFCLLSFGGIVLGCELMYEGTRPCGGDGCMIHFMIFLALIVFLIAGPIFYMTVRRAMRDFGKGEDY